MACDAACWSACGPRARRPPLGSIQSGSWRSCGAPSTPSTSPGRPPTGSTSASAPLRRRPSPTGLGKPASCIGGSRRRRGLRPRQPSPAPASSKERGATGELLRPSRSGSAGDTSVVEAPVSTSSRTLVPPGTTKVSTGVSPPCARSSGTSAEPAIVPACSAGPVSWISAAAPQASSMDTALSASLSGKPGPSRSLPQSAPLQGVRPHPGSAPGGPPRPRHRWRRSGGAGAPSGQGPAASPPPARTPRDGSPAPADGRSRHRAAAAAPPVRHGPAPGGSRHGRARASRR